MPQLRKPLLVSLVVSLGVVLTLLGLLDLGFVPRSDVDPRGAFDSEFLQARGYPIEWWVVETPDGLVLTFWDRILLGPLIADFFLALVAACVLIWAAWVLFRFFRFLFQWVHAVRS